MTAHYTVTYTRIYKVLKNNTLCKTKYQICHIMRVLPYVKLWVNILELKDIPVNNLLN